VADDASIVQSAGTVDLNGKTETLGTFSNSGGIFTTGKGGHLIGTGSSITWSGGTNTINADGSVEDGHVILTGGTNVVQGLAGTPVGTTSGGTLKVNAGGAGLEMTGATLTLNSDATKAGTLMLLGDVTAHASATTSNIANGGNATVAGNIDLSGGTRNFNVESGAVTVGLNVSASFSDGNLNKTGAGTMELSGQNFHAATTVTSGTLQSDVGSLVNVTGDITVNSGGTLLLSGNGRHIGANVNTNLNGGTFNTGGFSEPNTAGLTIGALTLQASSLIDLGNAASIINFADSSSKTWTGIVSILDWSGTPVVGGGTDQLIFGTNTLSGGITAAQLTEIQFVNPDGFAAGTYNAIFDPSNLSEILPGTLIVVPEPGTWVAGVLLASSLVLLRRKSRVR
jgi:autotransporter-associated beta strand protein